MDIWRVLKEGKNLWLDPRVKNSKER